MSTSGSLRVLLVDDSPTLRALVKYDLADLGIEFVEADSATRAMAIVKAMPVDLIITDVHMPGTDGFGFLANLRKHPVPAVSGLPVLLLTANRTEAIAQKAKEIGAEAIFHKPLSVEPFRAAVLRALGRDS